MATTGWVAGNSELSLGPGNLYVATPNSAGYRDWETDTDFQQRKLAKQVEAAEASKKVTEDEQAAKEKITETHTQARIGAEQSIQNAMQQTLNATKADTNTRKAIAVATIAINEAESIAAAVASATKGDPYTIALRIGLFQTLHKHTQT